MACVSAGGLAVRYRRSCVLECRVRSGLWNFALPVLLSAAFAGCDSESKVIDPFPISMDLSAGSVVLKASENGDPTVDIVVDVLSPITVLDSYRSGGEVTRPLRRLIELTLFGSVSGAEFVPRVRFPRTPAYDLHPCDAPGSPTAPCQVGFGETTREIYGILGSDILSRSSVRFDFPRSQMRFFPDAAGSDSERSLACDAVFSRPFSGGGTLLIGGNEVSFAGYRPSLGACIHTDAIPEPGDLDSEVGIDLHMAISTSFAPTILSEQAYRRYAESAGAVPLENLVPTTLYLPSGPVPARAGTIPYMAIVGEAGEDSRGRGPCRELYANARMRTSRSCASSFVDCPCPDGRQSCKAAAAVEISKGISIAVVDSGLPLLQALRDELRPRTPEIDGIIGVQALSDLRVEFDYPNGRMLMRCQTLDSCVTRQEVRSQAQIDDLALCRMQEDELRDAIPDAGPVGPDGGPDAGSIE